MAEAILIDEEAVPQMNGEQVSNSYLKITPTTTPADYLNSLLQNQVLLQATTGKTPAEYLMELDNSTPWSSDEDEELEHYKRPMSPPLIPLDEKRTGICYDARMRFHSEIPTITNVTEGHFHPEDPKRILAIYKLLCENGLVENPLYTPKMAVTGRPLKKIPSRYATKEECDAVHDPKHFDWLHKTSQMTDEELLDLSKLGDSVYFNQSTYASALLAAGSAIETTMAVVRGEVKNAFAVIRPPGHHAEPPGSSGFCHFDNVAVAVKKAMSEDSSIKKVMVLDWDVHHGNGIQRAFEEDPNVLYISIHVHMGGHFYPNSRYGGIESAGVGAGLGTSLNIAWEKQGMRDGDYLLAFNHVIMPVGQEFNPDLVVIAAGFDAAEGDQLGGCFVTPSCYAQMTHSLMSLAGGKVVACLEGGYNLRSISLSALAVVKTLMGEAPSPVQNCIPSASGQRDVFNVIGFHGQFWKSLVPKNNHMVLDAITDAQRLHDIIRRNQAAELFKEYKMFELPIHRDENEINSITFEKQVLVTPNFRRADEILLIFHDHPVILANPDPVSGDLPLASPKIIDPVSTIIPWAIMNGLAVIDVNIPDFYTGISIESPEPGTAQHNKEKWRTQLQIVSTYVWDNYITLSAAKRVVMLGLGDAYLAVSRTFSSHSYDVFKNRPTMGIGVIHTRVPDAPNESVFLDRFEDCYSKWTKIWAPREDRAFRELRNGKTKKKYGNCIASPYRGLSNMLNGHLEEIKDTILYEGFLRTPVATDEDDIDNEAMNIGGSGADSIGRSILSDHPLSIPTSTMLGKRTRGETHDVAAAVAGALLGHHDPELPPAKRVSEEPL